MQLLDDYSLIYLSIIKAIHGSNYQNSLLLAFDTAFCMYYKQQLIQIGITN